MITFFQVASKTNKSESFDAFNDVSLRCNQAELRRLHDERSTAEREALLLKSFELRLVFHSESVGWGDENLHGRLFQ